MWWWNWLQMVGQMESEDVDICWILEFCWNVDDEGEGTAIHVEEWALILTDVTLMSKNEIGLLILSSVFQRIEKVFRGFTAYHRSQNFMILGLLIFIMKNKHSRIWWKFWSLVQSKRNIWNHLKNLSSGWKSCFFLIKKKFLTWGSY